MNIWLEGYPVTITKLSDDDLNKLQDHYLQHCLNISEEDRISSISTGRHKNESQRWNDPAFFQLWNDTLEPYFRQYVNAFDFKFPWEMRINTWYNVHGKYDFQYIHDHITTDCPAFSAAVLLKQPNGEAGQFCFHTPNLSKHLKYLELDPLNAYSTAYEPPMVDGAIILFPSCLDHYVTRNVTDEYRVVFASNIVVKRTSSLF